VKETDVLEMRSIPFLPHLSKDLERFTGGKGDVIEDHFACTAIPSRFLGAIINQLDAKGITISSYIP
jgi:hypothetical protein